MELVGTTREDGYRRYIRMMCATLHHSVKLLLSPIVAFTTAQSQLAIVSAAIAGQAALQLTAEFHATVQDPQARHESRFVLEHDSGCQARYQPFGSRSAREVVSNPRTADMLDVNKTTPWGALV